MALAHVRQVFVDCFPQSPTTTAFRRIWYNSKKARQFGETNVETLDLDFLEQVLKNFSYVLDNEGKLTLGMPGIEAGGNLEHPDSKMPTNEEIIKRMTS